MKSSDAAEFTALWTAAQSKIAAFIRMLVPAPGDAEEILQRVAVALVQKYSNFDKDKSFVAWAIGMARYEILYYRRQRVHDKHLFSEDIVQNLAECCEELSGQWDNYRDALKNCLLQLENRSRKAIELRYSDNMRSEAIAKEMSITSSAARVMLCRVRRVLRECIQRQLGDLEDMQWKTTGPG